MFRRSKMTYDRVKKLTRLEKTAYHEAAHGVAAYCLNRRFKCVTIVADEDSLGRILFHRPPEVVYS